MKTLKCISTVACIIPEKSTVEGLNKCVCVRMSAGNAFFFGGGGGGVYFVELPLHGHPLYINTTRVCAIPPQLVLQEATRQ